MEKEELDAIVRQYKRYGEVLLFTEFEEDETETIFREILRKNKGKKVTILINSNGGSQSALRTTLNLITHYKIKTTGIVIGKALSAGMFLLQYCDKRLAYPNTSLLVHFGSLLIGNSLLYRLYAPEILTQFSAIDEINAIYTPYINQVMMRSGLSLEQVLQLMSLEVELNPQKALEMGLLDGIIGQAEK